MSVLACSRLGCDNVMCDYYSDEHGYICWECLRELREKGSCDIETFMGSVKKSDIPEDNWDEYLDKVFTNRNEL